MTGGAGSYPGYASQPATVGYQQAPTQQPAHAQQYQQQPQSSGYGKFLFDLCVTINIVIFHSLICCWLPTYCRTDLRLSSSEPAMGDYLLTYVLSIGVLLVPYTFSCLHAPPSYHFD